MKELKVLTRFIKPYKWWIVLATICMVIVTAASIAGPWIIRSLVETVTNKGNANEVKILALILVGIYIIRAFTRFGTNYISHYAAWKILEDIRSFDLITYTHGPIYDCIVNESKEPSGGKVPVIPTLY